MLSLLFYLSRCLDPVQSAFDANNFLATTLVSVSEEELFGITDNGQRLN